MFLGKEREVLASIPQGHYTFQSLTDALEKSLTEYRNEKKITVEVNNPNSVLKIDIGAPTINKEVAVSHALSHLINSGLTLTTTVLCKSNANEYRRNSWLFGAFRRNFASRDISSTNRDSSPHFRDTYCLERPDISSDISRCMVVCCDLSRDNSLLVKVRSELSWEDLSAFEQSSQ